MQCSMEPYPNNKIAAKLWLLRVGFSASLDEVDFNRLVKLTPQKKSFNQAQLMMEPSSWM